MSETMTVSETMTLPETMPTSQEMQAAAASLRFLAALYRAAPDAAEFAPVAQAIRDGAIAREWPVGEAERLRDIEAKMRAGLDRDDLKSAHQRLFVGPLDFAAPAWGSVYLDPESVLFGDSTLKLRAFLRRIGATMDTGLNEPEDHVGLVLWLAADLAGAGRGAELREALETHLLAWSGRYLELLAAHAAHPFYEGLAALTALTLDDLQAALGLRPREAPLYR